MRRYVSPLREQTAQRTRQAVLAAARALFIEQGYLATTVEQIAERAGVSKPTVFASVGSKRTLLKKLLDFALAGDEHPVAVAQRPWYQEAVNEPDPWGSLRLYARNVVGMHERSADLHEALRSGAAADKELEELWQASEDQRRIGATILVEALVRRGPLKTGLNRNTAIDVLWVLTSSDSFLRLVRVRGWTPKQYEKWLGDIFCDQLLPMPPT